MAYEPTTWKDGDTITAELLNKLEQGVQNEQVGPQGPKGDTPVSRVPRDRLVKRARKAIPAPRALPGKDAVLTAATTEALGAVKQMAAIADLSAAPTQEDFNGLLAKLRTAGMLAQA